MHIIDGHIYDFGKLHDYTFDFQDKSLIIIQGENEAGKSTLKSFIIYILFGMRTRELESFIPRTGGMPGGRLTLGFADGEVIVERIQDRHNGQAVCYVGMEQKDQQWLDERLGGMDPSVFRQVFLLDTEMLVSLQMTDKEQIGQVLLDAGQTGAAAIQKLKKQLQQDLQQLFRPQGRKPKINSMLHMLHEQERLVQELQQKEAAYLPDKEKLQEIHEKIAALQTKKAALRGKISVQNQLLQAIPWQKKAAFAQEQLQQMESVAVFPGEGLERMQEIQHQLQPLEAQYHVHEKEIASIRQELESTEKQLMKEDVYKELYDLTVRTDWTGSEKRMQQLKEESVKLRNQTASIRLSYPYPEDFFFDAYMSEAAEEWRPMQEEMMILQADSERTHQAIASKRQEIEKIDHLQERIQQSLLSEKEYRELHTQQDKKHTANDFRMGILSPISFLFVFALLLGGIGIVMLNWVLVGSGVFLIGGAALFWILGHTSSGSSSYAGEKLTEQQDLRVRWRQLEEQRHPLEIQLVEIQQEQATQLKQRENLQRIANIWMERFPCLQDIPLVDWLKATQEWKTREQLERMLERTEQELEEQRHHDENAIHQLQGIIGLPCDFSQKETIGRAEYVLETQQKLRHVLEQLSVRQRDIEHHLFELDKQIKPLQQQKEQLYAFAGAQNDSQFLQLAELDRKKKQLVEELEHYRIQIKAIMPDGRSLEEDIECEQEMVEQRIANFEMEHESVEEELDRYRQQAATLQVKQADLESDTEASIAYHEMQRQKQVLTAAGRKWAVRKLAYDMLLQTKRTFQEENFPKVLSEASRLFCQVADTYNALTLSDEGKLIVKDSYNREIEVGQLSRGTIEQLYLCLRLALSRHLGVRESFPLLIDDAFSHTDHTRRGRFLPILQAAANVQQIILFTWEEPSPEWSREFKMLQLGKTQKTSS
ncbi:Uncharacterized protein YhaN [Terribacillus halophilus]|uniref:Uncharacterized protein YhaN n=1 Tax=Terribacillus halophilus TaxID=361279 RepID=A0A1G6P9L6_9BACI|nr:AAA family ATPase [Terribacillus halophilus]SDC76681.1 Uncharacterized protein YhaN [Terribacillus halophilus]